jgi:diamine N-acetyltransferase
MTVRLAAITDARALAELAEHTFREAFHAMNSPDDMALHCRQSYSPAQQTAEILASDRATLLYDTEAGLAGYAQLRWGAAAPECVTGPTPGEVLRFYVRSEHHGHGVATALMDAALELLSQRGCRTAWLGVWERNPRAIAFYRKQGFVAVGEQTFVLGTDHQRDKVFVRPL